LLLLDERVDERIEESVEGRVDSGTALLNASIEDLHIGSCLQGFWFFVPSGAGKVLTEGDALLHGDVERFRELLNPSIGLSL